MTWISFKQYREVVPFESRTREPPLVDYDNYEDRMYKGRGPVVRIRTPEKWHDWGQAEFCAEDLEAWKAWDAEQRLLGHLPLPQGAYETAGYLGPR